MYKYLEWNDGIYVVIIILVLIASYAFIFSILYNMSKLFQKNSGIDEFPDEIFSPIKGSKITVRVIFSNYGNYPIGIKILAYICRSLFLLLMFVLIICLILALVLSAVVLL